METQITVACLEGVENHGGGGREKGRGDWPEGLHLLFPRSLSEQPLGAFLLRIFIFSFDPFVLCHHFPGFTGRKTHTHKKEMIDVSKN